jgi:hypothetical protein
MPMTSKLFVVGASVLSFTSSAVGWEPSSNGIAEVYSRIIGEFVMGIPSYIGVSKEQEDLSIQGQALFSDLEIVLVGPHVVNEKSLWSETCRISG